MYATLRQRPRILSSIVGNNYRQIVLEGHKCTDIVAVRMADKSSWVAMNLCQQNQVEVIDYHHDARVGLDRYAEGASVCHRARRYTGCHEYIGTGVTAGPVHNALVALSASSTLPQ
jgi:hypothetical protein